jgi:hypothetical protein
LAQNLLLPATRGQLVDLRPGARATSGGSSDSEKKDWQVKPVGRPSWMPVMSATPLAK